MVLNKDSEILLDIAEANIVPSALIIAEASIRESILINSFNISFILEGGIFFSGSFLGAGAGICESNFFTDIFFERKLKTSVISFSNLCCLEVVSTDSEGLVGIGTNVGFGSSSLSSRIDCLSSENASDIESFEDVVVG
jgi:hypothetical protein